MGFSYHVPLVLRPTLASDPATREPVIVRPPFALITVGYLFDSFLTPLPLLLLLVHSLSRDDTLGKVIAGTFALGQGKTFSIDGVRFHLVNLAGNAPSCLFIVISKHSVSLRCTTC